MIPKSRDGLIRLQRGSRASADFVNFVPSFTNSGATRQLGDLKLDLAAIVRHDSCTVMSRPASVPGALGYSVEQRSHTMATVAAVPCEGRSQLTCGQALSLAWASWFILLAIPALLFLAVMWTFIGDETHADQAGSPNAGSSSAWRTCAVAVPAAFFWRSREFKAYWEGNCVSPNRYLRGMLILWLTIEIGGVMALVGCFVTGSLLPNLLPAMVAFMLFTPFWPSGRAMTHPVGNDDDFEVYEEPR